MQVPHYIALVQSSYLDQYPIVDQLYLQSAMGYRARVVAVGVAVRGRIARARGNLPAVERGGNIDVVGRVECLSVLDAP